MTVHYYNKQRGRDVAMKVCSERIAFSIVRVDVRYPDGIVGIVLQYGSSNRIYLCIEIMSFEI